MTSFQKKWRILVVDDEPDLCDLLSEEFEYQNCLTFTAASGNAAFNIFEANEFDAVVSDIRMPNGNGLELLEKIKASQKSNTLVFLVTGFADISKEEAFAKGAVDLIGKPYDIIDLCAMILGHLGPLSNNGL